MRVGDDVDEEVKDCVVIDSGLVTDFDLPLLFCREPEWISKVRKGNRMPFEERPLSFGSLSIK